VSRFAQKLSFAFYPNDGIVRNRERAFKSSDCSLLTTRRSTGANAAPEFYFRKAIRAK